MGDDTKKEAKEIEELTAELDGMMEAYDAPRMDAPPKMRAMWAAEEYVTQVREYFRLRMQGEINQIVGDHPASKQSFELAKKIVAKLKAIRDYAKDGSFAEPFQKLVDEWMDQEKGGMEQKRAEAKHTAAKTGKAPTPVRAVEDGEETELQRAKREARGKRDRKSHEAGAVAPAQA